MADVEPGAPGADLLGARYGSESGPAMAADALNGTVRLLLAHRSVRAYLPDRLPPGTLETLVAAAQSAATSSNLQAWSVVAVEDPARKARLAAVARSSADSRLARGRVTLSAHRVTKSWLVLSFLCSEYHRLGRRAARTG